MPTTTTRTRVPDGYYSVFDTARGRLTHWHVTGGGRRLDPWPVGAKYGPLRPAYDPVGDAQERREATRRWKDERDVFHALVLAAIGADPESAGQLFLRWTGRCRSCRAELTVDDLQPSDAHEQHSEAEAHSPAARLLSAAMAGRSTDVRALLGAANPAEVIALLADVIATLAPLTGDAP
jgi:hypothetical protein